MTKTLEIVVVDDKEMITDLLENYIRISGIQANIYTFNDSRAALEFIKKSPNINVIITDYKMPGVNGIQLLEASPPDATRIMVSGYVSDIAEEKLTELNAIFFEKPVPMKKIGKLINDTLLRCEAPN